MSDAVSDEPDIRSLSFRLAMALEEQFIDAGWPSGQLFSSEEELRRRYGISRRAVSEAIRILEIRGTARLRRGSSTGLEVAAPDPDLVTETLRGYSYLNCVSEPHRVEALALFESAQRRIAAFARPTGPALALNFLKNVLQDRLTPGSPPLGKGMSRLRRNRAGRIALNLLDRYCHPAVGPGCKIGSEPALSMQYNADRSITRQAIRILESAALITSLPGRGNGIVTRRPGPGPAARLICNYLASQRLPHPAAFELFCAMSIEVIALAAHKATEEDLQRFQQIFAATWRAGRSAQMRDILLTENALFSAVKNPLIDLCIRSLRGYVAIAIAQSADVLPNEIATCFARHTEQVVEEIRCRRPEIAAAAHEHKLIAIRELQKQHQPGVAQLLYGGLSPAAKGRLLEQERLHRT